MKHEIEHLTVQEMIAALKVIQEALEHLPEDCGPDLEIRLDGWSRRIDVFFIGTNAFYQAAAHFGAKYACTSVSGTHTALEFMVRGVRFRGLLQKRTGVHDETQVEIVCTVGENGPVFLASTQS